MDYVRNLQAISFSFIISFLLCLPAYAGLDFAYITDYKASENICKVNITANMQAGTIGVGCEGNGKGKSKCEPYWIAKSGDQNLLAASLHTDQGVALIDPETMTLIERCGLPCKECEAVAVNMAGTRVYVADEKPQGNGDSIIYELDSSVGNECTLLSTNTLLNCEEAENMVISPDDSTLYIACSEDNAGTKAVFMKVLTSDLSSSGQMVLDTSDDCPGKNHGVVIDDLGDFVYYTCDGDVNRYETGDDNTIDDPWFTGCDMYNGAIETMSGPTFWCADEMTSVKVYDLLVMGAPLQTINLPQIPFQDKKGKAKLANCVVADLAFNCDESTIYLPCQNSVLDIDINMVTGLGDLPPGVIPLNGDCKIKEDKSTDKNRSAHGIKIICGEPNFGCCTVSNVCTSGESEANCFNQGGTFIEDMTCFSQTSCTEVPPIEGCCQTDTSTCENLNTVQCTQAGGDFFPGEMCTDPFEFCGPVIEGCCQTDTNACQELNDVLCTQAGGDFFPGGMCTDPFEACEPAPPPITTSIPTIGQWGMIAMAGLLGIFSLFIVMRRHRYNVS